MFVFQLNYAGIHSYSSSFKNRTRSLESTLSAICPKIGSAGDNTGQLATTDIANSSHIAEAPHVLVDKKQNHPFRARDMTYISALSKSNQDYANYIPCIKA